MKAPVSFAVEGTVDEAVVRKLFEASGVVSGTQYVCDGIGNLRKRLHGFNAAAHYCPWFVLCDLDRHECAPKLRSDFFETPQTERMELRVAVRAVEAWLMADRGSFASFLGVEVKHIPREPEQLANPKEAVVELARGSSKSAIREGLVPSKSSERRVGRAYTHEVIEYVHGRWSPNRARGASPSLARAFERCETFAHRGTWS